MANLTILPSVILEEILALLPSKSILRFRQVSKSWSSFLVSSEFQKLRTNKSTPPQTNLQKILKCSAVNDGYVIESLGCLGGGEDPVRLCFPTEKYMRLLGSCNGLVCVAVRHNPSGVDQIVIWNPFTGIYRKLQDICIKNRKRKLQDIDDRRICAYGFGYDSAADDYKVFIATKPAKVEIFSLKTGFWKEVETTDPGKDLEYIPEGHEVGLFLKGALHWHVLIGGRTKIIAFDLAKEKFYDVPMPVVEEEHSDEVEFRGLGVVGVYLCLNMALKRYDDVGAVCVMKEYCNAESWAHFIYYTSLTWVNGYAHPTLDFKPQAVKDGGYILILQLSGEVQHILKWDDNLDESDAFDDVLQNLKHIRKKSPKYQMAMPYIEALTSPYPSLELKQLEL
ncbi:hypothetical protein Tsubulata_023478 [Turnera subulata]|uniref:F-box domain-containing protein n=1 Tax=Turnera subulata TaxID=218843 RepID=A0A9Q0J0K2_9ROSI|nr:hypothetical protein Tsubulata_023478 [Turnera subulata]